MDQIHRYVDFPCIIPTIVEDYLRMHTHFIRLFYNLRISKLIFIGPATLKSYIDKDISDNLFCDYHVEFLDENNLFDVTFKDVSRYIYMRGGDVKRTGWYFQQYLKMNYATICEDEYYLLWDADTIPLKKIKFFDSNKMLFNLKEERHQPYFSVLNKLFDNKLNFYCNNDGKNSFITEGMIIKKSIMIEIINTIGNSNVAGKKWFEKIINSIDADDLSKSGFSEFETYGSYLNTYYSNLMKIRMLNTCRNGMSIFGPDVSDERLSKLPFDTISFENWDKSNSFFVKCIKQLRYFLRTHV